MEAARHEVTLVSRMSAHGARQPHSQHGLSLQTHHVVMGVMVLRAINAICTGKTFFQPDEYFQAIEPAWSLAFGPQSGAWLTWVRELPSYYS